MENRRINSWLNTKHLRRHGGLPTYGKADAGTVARLVNAGSYGTTAQRNVRHMLYLSGVISNQINWRILMATCQFSVCIIEYHPQNYMQGKLPRLEPDWIQKRPERLVT